VPQLKTINQHIVIFLIALFAVTMLPYNVLHHHAEDEHVAAMIHHEKHPAHHCELDDMACKIDLTTDCGHATHISKTHPKCFSCDFHFVKLYEASAETLLGGQASTLFSFKQPQIIALHGAFLFVGNKGPPQGV
jgi:hypothetical protein